MRVASPIRQRRARIEIIPLIDVMFFLLASFMMVSLTMIRLQSMKMNLPTATKATGEKLDLININVDRNGDTLVDKQHLSRVELHSLLTNRFLMNSNVSVYITGNPEASHGTVIGTLDAVRLAGISRVSFNISEPTATERR
jgi:biopolymer transport protein ExbD